MKRFTHIYICFFILHIGISSCNSLLSPAIMGDGRLINREIAISDYTGIELNSTAHVIYEQKSAKLPYLQIYIDENLMPELDIRVDGERLVIAAKNGKNLMPSQFKIYTNSRNLNSVRSNGTGDVHLKGEVNAPKMAINIRGTGDVVADSLYCEKIEVTITGTGHSLLAGVANDAIFTISGTGNIRAFDFFIQQLNAFSSGTGNMDVCVSDYLKAVISGTGNIRYVGEPKTVDKTISGTGRLVKQ